MGNRTTYVESPILDYPTRVDEVVARIEGFKIGLPRHDTSRVDRWAARTMPYSNHTKGPWLRGTIIFCRKCPWIAPAVTSYGVCRCGGRFRAQFVDWKRGHMGKIIFRSARMQNRNPPVGIRRWRASKPGERCG